MSVYPWVENRQEITVSTTLVGYGRWRLRLRIGLLLVQLGYWLARPRHGLPEVTDTIAPPAMKPPKRLEAGE